MRTAVVYDSLISRGGAERAALVLARAFNAEIWTTTYLPEAVYPEYAAFRVYDHPLKSLTTRALSGPLDLIRRGLIHTESIFKYRRMNLADYDLVITIGRSSKHVPIYRQTRRLHYELYVVTEYEWEWLFRPWVWYMNKIDQEMIRRLSALACNSENTRTKIRTYYKREAQVVYPAVDIKMFRGGEAAGYFLAVERIAPEKGIETQLQAFRRVPERKLMIVGSPKATDRRYYQKLRRMAPQNVSFLGSISDEELAEVYSHAEAVIQTNPDEDFGRVPVEAMASGKPCIAVNAGGYRETIVNGETGMLIDRPYVDNLAEATRRFNGRDYDGRSCRRRAEQFSEEAHIEKMRGIIARIT